MHCAVLNQYYLSIYNKNAQLCYIICSKHDYISYCCLLIIKTNQFLLSGCTLTETSCTVIRNRLLSDTDIEEYTVYAAHVENALVRVQPHSKRQWKSLTLKQSRKYQQPKSHSLPHTAFLCINRETVEEEEIEREKVREGELEIKVYWERDAVEKKWGLCDSGSEGGESERMREQERQGGWKMQWTSQSSEEGDAVCYSQSHSES